MSTPESDWRVKLAGEIAEMEALFVQMAAQEELTPEDRAELMNFAKGVQLPVSEMAEIYRELLSGLAPELSERMKGHLREVFAIGPLPRWIRGSRLLMIGPRTWDPMREMLGISTSENSG